VTTTASKLPRLPANRPSAAVKERYELDVLEFCKHIMEVASRLDFRVSARGWGYVLEGDAYIDKDDIDAAEQLVNRCRKDGRLPINICSDDTKRATENLEELDDPDPAVRARQIVNYVRRAEQSYLPFSFWDDQEFYVQHMVEKSDLKSLFQDTCNEFRIPIANWGGWADLNVRADFMRRFAEKEAEGKQCVLLAAVDFDPGGLSIAEFIKSNLEDLADAVGWWPTSLIIDHYALSYDYIVKNELVWVNNLITGNKGKWKGIGLDNPKHPDHLKPYVQDYLHRYCRKENGLWLPRKVEANALLKTPAKARALCRKTILKYLPEDAPEKYEDALAEPRERMRKKIARLLEL
jgi:hypothetical protein